MFALQEIGATHSVAGSPKCHYLDLIVGKLNEGIANDSANWTYILDSRNKNQRLAYLYKQDLWTITNTSSIYPGSSFQYIRRPFLATVQATGSNAQITFNFINLHLKAFPDASSRERRVENVEQLANWLETQNLDDDVLISGDTNIYYGETEVDDPLKDIGYDLLYDQEKTAIHDGVLGQRFDRFFCSPGLKNEIDSAKEEVGNAGYIDVIKDNDEEAILWFDENISDHYPVILHIDVSEER